MPRRVQPDNCRAVPLGALLYRAKSPTEGVAPTCKRHIYGGAKPPPHIKRQSRARITDDLANIPAAYPCLTIKLYRSDSRAPAAETLRNSIE